MQSVSQSSMDSAAALAPYSALLNSNPNTNFGEVRAILNLTKNRTFLECNFGIEYCTSKNILPNLPRLRDHSDARVREQAEDDWKDWGTRIHKAYQVWQSGVEGGHILNNTKLLSALKEVDIYTNLISYRFGRSMEPGSTYDAVMKLSYVDEFFWRIDETVKQLTEQSNKLTKQSEAQGIKILEQQSSITNAMAAQRAWQSEKKKLSDETDSLRRQLEKANEKLKLSDTYRQSFEEAAQSRDTWQEAHSQVVAELEHATIKLEDKQIEVNDLQADLESSKDNVRLLEAECARTKDYDKVKQQLGDARAEISGLRSNSKRAQDKIKNLEAVIEDLRTQKTCSLDDHAEAPGAGVDLDEPQGQCDPVPTAGPHLGPEHFDTNHPQNLHADRCSIEDDIDRTANEGKMNLALQHSVSKGKGKQKPSDEFPALPQHSESKVDSEPPLPFRVKPAKSKSGKKGKDLQGGGKSKKKKKKKKGKGGRDCIEAKVEMMEACSHDGSSRLA
ncbi:uncharacterized protein N0V89_003409 [Didymosphaeria variabile]|uniref:Uncharacterized protein n=1 Tax=Didymosphaeria variabile TaxID=1932322 RepID=A0A9W8XMK9_9PLEO|nr:uncharacterized protein N0V89_003409 [Didymosphaeria variabile]KAJ4355393.1 hypothetical protein N0V89_003409 [Didymosphaeria variabile]